jgi:uncharacterized protein YdgA (DUF945 family)
MRDLRARSQRWRALMNRPVLLILIGTGVITLLLTPWMFGALAQQRVDAGIARLDAEDDLDASVVDYARGWTMSTATIELDRPDAVLRDSDIPPELAELIERLAAEPIRLVVTMRHGPVLLGEATPLGIAASTIHLDPELPRYREFLNQTGLEHLFEIRTVTGFDGQSDFVAEMPAFSFNNNDGVVDFAGADATGTYDALSRRFQAQGQANHLRMTDDDGTLTVESVAFDSDSTWHSPLLRFGYAEASVVRIAVESPVEQFLLENVSARFDVEADDDGEHATMASEYSLGRFSDGDEINLDDVALAATARRVNVAALTAYVDASQQAALQNDAAAPLALGAEDALYDLLGSSPQIDLEPIRFTWNGEPLNATVRIAVTSDNLPPRTNFTLLTLAFQGVVAIDATLAVSDVLANLLAARGLGFQLRRAAAQEQQFMTDDEVQMLATAQASIALAALVAQGMLTQTDDGYEATARFADGTLTVNGNVVPLGLR